MKFRKGDTVSFKDEKQNGVVTAVMYDKVMVETTDGFEFEVMASALILLERKNQEQEPQSQLEKNDTLLSSYKNYFKIEEGSIAWIAIPKEESQVSSGSVEFHIGNFSPFELLFTVYSKTKGKKLFNKLVSGQTNAYADAIVGSFSRRELEDMDSIYLQVLLAQSIQESVAQPLIKNLSLNLPSIDQMDAQASGRFAFRTIQTIFSSAKELTIDPFTIGQNSVKEKEKEQKELGNVLDLHMESLLSDSNEQVDPDQSLMYQMHRFITFFQKAYEKNLSEITVIHGVGDGILKSRIYRYVTESGIATIEAASMLKYGAGAALIKFN
ncbi:MAG TPA: hypothetical protein PKH65_03690 [Bacteroidia bacterium]|nr:hypothetical protein [Bacteroidia bacterium]HNT79762.1 hypothetical protein [Bacteroidia bacterium]